MIHSKGRLSVRVLMTITSLALAGVLVLSACGLGSGPQQKQAAAPTPDGKQVYLPLQASNSKAPSGETGGAPAQGSQTVIIEVAPAVPSEVRQGSCFSPALTTPRENAWRCMVDSEIFDPCLLAEDGKTLVCGVDPTKNVPGFVLEQTGPLPTQVTLSGQPASAQAWLVELSDGVICGFATGATMGFNDQRVNYLCTDRGALLGDLKPGEPWTAQRVVIGSSEQGPVIQSQDTVTIVKIWK